MVNLGPLSPVQTIDVYPVTKNGEHFAFSVPGVAYIDGRDLSASPPLTVNKINLWNGPIQARVVGYLYHGIEVRLTEALEYDGRWFFKVRFGTRMGWVSEYILSDDSYAPVGEVI